MKIQSKALYTFLVESGAINGTKVEIQSAKKEFRRKYQRENKRKRKMLKPDVRVSFTQKELFELKVRSIETGMTHTDYVKQVVLSSIGKTSVIPNRTDLEEVLQAIGIAATLLDFGRNYNISEVMEQLLKAEGILASYLKK